MTWSEKKRSTTRKHELETSLFSFRGRVANRVERIFMYVSTLFLINTLLLCPPPPPNTHSTSLSLIAHGTVALPPTNTLIHMYLGCKSNCSSVSPIQPPSIPSLRPQHHGAQQSFLFFPRSTYDNLQFFFGTHLHPRVVIGTHAPPYLCTQLHKFARY